MSVYQAHASSETGTAILIDARPGDRYATSHVPGAVNLPPDAFEEKYPDLAPQIETAGSAIVYCEGIECSDSIFVAERIREVFSGPVSVVERGWPAWVLAGYPITSGEQP
jgi:rhodanese-related sulfurtransferase